MRPLFACPSCACHVRAGERRCPHCDAPLGPDNGTAKSAAAALMGLATVMTYSAGGCGSSVSSSSTSTGVATGSNVSTSSSSYTMNSSVFAAYAASPSTGTGPCVEMGTDTCAKCVTAPYPCGVPTSGNVKLKNCNNTPGNSSLDKYTSLYDCLCGIDGKTGACGAQCSKTCLGTGMDAMGCAGCVSGAFASDMKCGGEYTACNTDK